MATQDGRLPDLTLRNGPPTARWFRYANGIGVATLIRRELGRDFEIWTYTIAAPAVQTTLFALIFMLAWPQDRPLLMGGLAYMQFLIPGLIASAMLTRSFESSAFSLVMDKLEGMITDLLAAPLTPGELLLGYTVAAATSGLSVAGVVWIAMLPFGASLPANPAALASFAVLGAVMMALLGRIAGIISAKWDQLSAFQTFIVMPLVFLSGTFFALDRLPEASRPLFQFNPLFYVIDGLRFGFTGRSEAPVLLGLAVISGVVLAVWILCYVMIRRGYKLKP